MLLVVDIGNTNTVIGVFRDEELLGHWRLVSERRTADELGLLLLNLLRSRAWGPADFRGVIVSSVVPPLDGPWREALERYAEQVPLVVSTDLDLGLEVRYGVPQEVGADRLVNAVAGVAAYGCPLALVDLGTAITLDVVDPSGAYLGGAIAPGLAVSMETLFARTAKLPQVSLEAPKSVIGRSTLESIRSGIVYGYAGLIDALVDRVFEELGTRCPVVATGGHAAILAKHSRNPVQVDPWLTLKGLRLLYLRNAPR